MAGLLRTVEDHFDAALVAWIGPSLKKSTNGIKMKDLLERQSDFQAHYVGQGHVEDWIDRHERCPP
jgi:hypothetical protein